MSLVMRNISWSLGFNKYDDYDIFVIAVTNQNKDIDRKGNEWNPDRVISKTAIKILYEAGWRDENDKIDLKIGEPDSSLTMGRILFTLNNETFDFFKDVNRHFFEGLELIDGTTYKLRIGS